MSLTKPQPSAEVPSAIVARLIRSACLLAACCFINSCSSPGPDPKKQAALEFGMQQTLDETHRTAPTAAEARRSWNDISARNALEKVNPSAWHDYWHPQPRW